MGGVFSNESYASSFPLPEQIYLEEIWKLNEEGHFVEPVPGSKGVIILNDIFTLETDVAISNAPFYFWDSLLWKEPQYPSNK